MSGLNVVFFFFNDDYSNWPQRHKIDPFVDNNPGVTVTGVTFPVNLLTLFSNPARFVKFLLRPRRKIQEGIYSFTPFGLLPVTVINKNRILINIHKWLYKIQIDNFLDSIKASQNRITWIYYLWAAPVFSDIVEDSKLLVYQCDDEYTMEGAEILKEMKEIEDDLLKKADVVVAVSNKIYDARKQKNKNCYLVPNAIDFDFFNKAASADTPLNEEMKDIPHPIAGYLGVIRSWVDFELLGFLADSLPKVSFVFVGPVEADVKKKADALWSRPNVRFLGNKDREVLPGILKGFDACLIPFSLNEFNLSTNPWKFWEYLATGKPILSLKIPDFEVYGDIVALYTTKEEALDKLRVILEKVDDDKVKRRMQLAKSNDVVARSKKWYDIVTKRLYDKNRDSGK